MTAEAADIIVMRVRASPVKAVTSDGALLAAYATVGKKSVVRMVVSAKLNNFIFFHNPKFGTYCVAPNAPVAKSEMILVNTNAPSTTAKPMAEYMIVFLERSSVSGFPELVM